jgi:hypothetical protein
MNPKLLRISLERFSNAAPEVNVWNIFDSEHPAFMHGKRKNGEGMDPSFILYETDNMNVTLDSQRLPIVSWIGYSSIMVHVATRDNAVVQYSSFFGVPTVQRYSATPTGAGITKYDIEIVFYLTGFWKLLAPLIKKYVTYWLRNTWDEDLIMKERRQKFLELGFRDMIGMPARVGERNGKVQALKLPLPRVSDQVDSHPFCFKNLDRFLGRP